MAARWVVCLHTSFFKRGHSKKAKHSKQAEEEENSWPLGKNRYVKVREYKNKLYVDVREFYDAGGELKPGKKGISLSIEQWNKLKRVVDEVDEAIAKIKDE